MRNSGNLKLVEPVKFNPRIAHSRPTLGPEEERAVSEVVRGGMLTGATRLREFEGQLARRLGRNNAVAVTSGSAAIHLAMKAMGIGRGHRVAIPSYECISLLQSVKRAGAEPLVVDCDPSTFHMDVEDLRRRGGESVEAILVSHTFGNPADLEELLRIGPPLVEDISTALGSRSCGRPAGSTGVLAVCSFNATKMITSGSGGAVISDDRIFMDKVKDLITYDAREDQTVRYNERLGEIPAALGLSQLRRLNEFLSRRREIASRYRKALSGEPIQLPKFSRSVEPAWHRFVVRIPGGATGIRARLAAAGIDTPDPIHMPIHQALGLAGYPGADEAQREALSLPIYPTLTDSAVEMIIQEVQVCLSRN
jgi:perosamine synthetase